MASPVTPIGTLRDDERSSVIMKSFDEAPNGLYRTPNESSGSDTRSIAISDRWEPAAPCTTRAAVRPGRPPGGRDEMVLLWVRRGGPDRSR